MKRDLVLLRKILIAIKKEETIAGLTLNQEILGFLKLEEPLYQYHIALLKEAGLIISRTDNFDHQSILQPTNLSVIGQTFLENIQNNLIWSKLIELDSKVSTSLDLLMMIPLAEHYSKKQDLSN